MLPTVESFDTEATACVPVVASPKCDKVELVLPKQVCRELLYGYAEKPVHTYKHSDTPAVVKHPDNHPVIIKHSSKIRYGPKLPINPAPASEAPAVVELSKIPDTYTVTTPE